MLQTENVFLFVPNLIGYARVILAIISFYYMPTNYVVAACCYIISGLLDALDGHAARALGQCSKFGAMLDMLTDRCATMCLCVTLAHLYPQWSFWFQLSICVDIVSHWMHMQVELMKGNFSHKSIDLSTNPILYHYYTNRKILFGMCAGNELFYSMVYICYFTTGPLGVFKLLALVSFPVAMVKSGISLVHLWAACINLAGIDSEERKKQAKQ